MSLATRHEAEIVRMEHVLASYGGVLTEERLFEFCGADHWPLGGTFRWALSEAVATGRLKRLGPELVELPLAV